MKSTLQLLVIAIVAISFPTIALTLLTGLFWALFSITIGQSFVTSFLLIGLGVLLIVKRLQYEIKEFNIDLDNEDEEFL